MDLKSAVHLVAPAPEAPARSGISRRALLAGMSASALTGFGVGFGVAWRSGPAAPAATPPETPPSQRLDWALRLQSGPVEDLLRHHVAFLWAVETERDRRLGTGLRRLARAVLDSDPRLGPDRVALAQELARSFSWFDAEMESDLVRGLRAVR